jgi:cytidine deaminase
MQEQDTQSRQQGLLSAINIEQILGKYTSPCQICKQFIQNRKNKKRKESKLAATPLKIRT